MTEPGSGRALQDCPSVLTGGWWGGRADIEGTGIQGVKGETKVPTGGADMPCPSCPGAEEGDTDSVQGDLKPKALA